MINYSNNSTRALSPKGSASLSWVSWGTTLVFIKITDTNGNYPWCTCSLETKVLEVGRYTLIIGDMLCGVLKQVEIEFEKLLFGRKRF